MSEREERLLRIEGRSEQRIKRRRALFNIAWSRPDIDRANRYADLTTEAKHLHERLWLARVEAGTRRWAECRDHGTAFPNLRTLAAEVFSSR